MKAWAPVIFCGLYIAALVLTWVTLFSLERFAETDVRAWAPFLQAILSAGAIFSAWWLQDLKRRSDRRQAGDDAVIAMLHYARGMEILLRGYTIQCRTGTLTGPAVATGILAFRAAVDSAAKINPAHFPSENVVRESLALIHNAYLALGILEFAKDQKGFVKKDFFDASWKRMHRDRSDLLAALGIGAPDERPFNI